MIACALFVWAALLLPAQSWADYRALVLSTATPAHYYRLGESSGTAAADVCNENSATACGYSCGANCGAGTYSGGFTLAQSGALSGDSNTAVSLNGSTGQVQLPTDSKQPLTNKNFSFAIWIKPAAAGDILSMSNAVDRGTFRVIYTGGNKILFRIYDNASSCATIGVFGDALSTNTFATGSWYLIAVTTAQNGSTLTSQKVYVGSALEATNTSFVGTMCTATHHVYLGTWLLPTVNHFNGVLDEPAFWVDKELTLAEVTALNQCGTTGACGDLINRRRIFQVRAETLRPLALRMPWQGSRLFRPGVETLSPPRFGELWRQAMSERAR